MNEVRVAILDEHGFIPTELALVQDILRIAGRLSGSACFSACICTSTDTDLVEGMSGVLVRAKPFRVDDVTLPNHLIVLGGTGVRARFDQLKARLRWFERMGQSIILLSDAALEWKQLHPGNDRIPTHWEDQQLCRDAGCLAGDELPLFAQTSRVTTAAGMMSTADVVLNVVIAPLSIHLAQAVANVLLMDRIRIDAAHQPRSENDVDSLRLTNLEPVIAAMEEHPEAPLSMVELASIASSPVRQLERKSKSSLGQSPMAFYQSLRLRQASILIEQTTLPITEIPVACGFGASSNFSRMFTREYGLSPRRRTQLSAAAPLHILTSQTQGSDHALVPLPTHSSCPSSHAAGAHETLVQGTRH